jgi:hypothetical protein
MRGLPIYESGWISAPQSDSQRSHAIIGTVIKVDKEIPIHIIKKTGCRPNKKKHTKTTYTLICRHENARKNRNMMISSSISLRH